MRLNEVTFNYKGYDEDAREGTLNTASRLRAFPDMLRHYKDFLQGVSFNYVKNVYAVKEDDTEVTKTIIYMSTNLLQEAVYPKKYNISYPVWGLVKRQVR